MFRSLDSLSVLVLGARLILEPVKRDSVPEYLCVVQLDMVLRLGVPTERIVFANACKRPRDIRHAAQKQVRPSTFPPAVVRPGSPQECLSLAAAHQGAASRRHQGSSLGASGVSMFAVCAMHTEAILVEPWWCLAVRLICMRSHDTHVCYGLLLIHHTWV